MQAYAVSFSLPFLPDSCFNENAFFVHMLQDLICQRNILNERKIGCIHRDRIPRINRVLNEGHALAMMPNESMRKRRTALA